MQYGRHSSIRYRTRELPKYPDKRGHTYEIASCVSASFGIQSIASSVLLLNRLFWQSAILDIQSGTKPKKIKINIVCVCQSKSFFFFNDNGALLNSVWECSYIDNSFFFFLVAFAAINSSCNTSTWRLLWKLFFDLLRRSVRSHYCPDRCL